MWQRSLFPYGKSGLKWLMARLSLKSARSLPVWEEWIEITHTICHTYNTMSLPVWEEWIEIKGIAALNPVIPSLPVWEEWIEIHGDIIINVVRGGLFPYGKSGLK